MKLKALTPKMQDAIDKIRANGGRVGWDVASHRALGVNGTVTNALERRKILRKEYGSDRVLYLVLDSSACGADPCCEQRGTEKGCIFK